MNSALKAFRFNQRFAAMLIEDIDDADMTQLPHPGMNHPAWILGHLALASDLAANLLGQELQTDNEWMQKYGPGSTPIADRSAYPSKTELFELFMSISQRAEELVADVSDEHLNSPNETPFFKEQFPIIRDLLTHLLTTHAAMHLGQLSAWRRTVGKGSVLGI